MKAATQRRLGLGLFGAILLAGLAMSFLGGGEQRDRDAPSIKNFEGSGLAALYLLYEELGFEPRSWSRPPSSLPREDTLVLLSGIPRPTFFEDGEQSSRLDEITSSGESEINIHRPYHYRRFLDRGGLLGAGASEAMLRFLVEELELTELEGLELRDGPVGETTTLTGEGEALELRFERVFAEASLPDEVTPWLVDETRREPRALTLSVGRGELLLIADPELFRNGRLGEGDAGILAARVAEEFGRGRPILFDEYSLGRWSPRSPLVLATTGVFGLASFGALLFLFLIAWAGIWVGPFPRDPEPLSTVSPLARVRSVAALFARAGRFESLGDWLVRGAVQRARHAWKLFRRGDGDTETHYRELCLRAGLDPERFGAAFFERAPRSAQDLDALSRHVEEFEHDVERALSQLDPSTRKAVS